MSFTLPTLPYAHDALEPSIPTEDEEDDERVHLGAEDESERRKERQRRKDRQRKAQQRSREELETLRTQNHQLNERLANLERAAGNTTLAQLDDRISMARTQLAQANQALKAAMSKNNGDDFVKAQEVRDQARDVLNHLAGLKQRYQAQGGDQARERQQRQQVEQQEQPVRRTGSKHDGTIGQFIGIP